MHLPPRAASSASSPSEQVCTPIMRSSSPSFMALLPADGTFAKSLALLRLTEPAAVANMSWSFAHSSSSSGIGRMVEMVSPAASGSRLTSALPRACGAACGRR